MSLLLRTASRAPIPSPRGGIEGAVLSWGVVVGIAVASTVFVSIIGCRRDVSTASRETVVFANPVLPHGALIHLAASAGYFSNEGLDVRIQPHQFGKPALDAVLEGKADLAACADTPIVLASLKGREISVLATVATSSSNTALVARKDAGIGSAEDLQGKRIGVALGTNGEFFLDTLLLRSRVQRGAITVVDLRPPDMAAALSRGDVDAVAIWNPVALDLKASLGDKVLTVYADDIYFESWNVVCLRGFVDRKNAATQKVLRALINAETFLRQRPDDARRLIGSALAGGPDVNSMLAQFDFRVSLDQNLLILLEDEARWAIRGHLAPAQATPNFLRVLDPRPLLAIKPEAVHLMR